MNEEAPESRPGLPIFLALTGIALILLFAGIILGRRSDEASPEMKSKALADIGVLSSALQTFKLDVGRYPTATEGLNALYTPPTKVKGWKGPYVKGPMLYDPWGGFYDYKPGPAKSNTFSLRSLGSDHLPGGRGPDADIP